MTVFSGADGRLTPDEIRSYEFPSTGFGRRGLDEAHVWEFCRLAEQEIVRLLGERTSLADEVQRLRRRVLAGLEADSSARLDDVHIQAVGILSRAQQDADRYVADAREYSRQLTDDARRLRGEILAEARTRAEQLLEEAHGAASLAAEASLDVSVAHQGSDRGKLEAELAYLRTFSDVYRSHLHSYLDKLLRNVEEWDRAEKETLDAIHTDLADPPGVPAVPPLPPRPRVPPPAAGRPAVINEPADDWPLADGPVRPGPSGG
jgi:cell division septum initiation protein DivIVA